MNHRTFLLLLATTLAVGPLVISQANAADYVQDAGTLGFRSAFQGQAFDGVLPGFQATLAFDPAAPEQARLDVLIPLAQASTDDPDRDTTLQTGDFFDVANHGQARYRASGFQATGEGRWRTEGTLELRGVQQVVPLEFSLEGEAPLVLTGQATLSRLAFGVGGGDWADTSVIPDQVSVSTRVEFVPAS
ncbi:MAG: YceI family protein [Xanthomonadales bacterium]|nr:YceI family protein [Xanthomonadales bacterium]